MDHTKRATRPACGMMIAVAGFAARAHVRSAGFAPRGGQTFAVA